MAQTKATLQCHTLPLAITIQTMEIQTCLKGSDLINLETIIRVKQAITIISSRQLHSLKIMRFPSTTCNKNQIELQDRCSRGEIKTSILPRRWVHLIRACSQLRTERISIHLIQRIIMSSIIWWLRLLRDSSIKCVKAHSCLPEAANDFKL